MSQPPPSLVFPRANRFMVGIDRQVVVVARAARIDLEPGAVTADAHVSTAAHLNLTTIGADGLDQPVVANRNVQPAVDAKLDAVDGMIGAAKIEAETEPADERARLLGNAVAVGVAIGGQIRRVRDIQRVAIEHCTTRTVHRRKDGVVVCLAIVVTVDEAQDAPHARVRLQRAVPIDAHEELAGDRCSDARRIVDDGRCGEHLDLEAWWGLDAGENFLNSGRVDRQGPSRRHGRHISRTRGLLGERGDGRETDKAKGDLETTSVHVHKQVSSCPQSDMTSKSNRLVVLILLAVSVGLLIPGLFAPVLTIRGVLTREGVAHVAPTLLERGLSDETVAVLKSMMNPTIVAFLGATGGDLRKIILEKLTPQITAALQKNVEEVEVYEQTRSIVGSVRRLYEVGSPVPATLILLFSVIVPLAKAALVAWATFMAEGGRRTRTLRFVEAIGKWSMADVFVVALFIAYLAAQASTTPPGSPAPALVAFTAHFGAGFYWFTAYCVFSLASQQFTAGLAAED